MELFLGAVIWILLCILVGVYASSKGRSGIVYFIIATLLSPLLGFIIAIFSSPNKENVAIEQIKSGSMRKCPYCAELVKGEAIICKHCGKGLPELQLVVKERFLEPFIECNKCGKETYHTEKQCSFCKADLDKSIAK